MFVASTHEVTNSRYFQKKGVLGLFATTDQLAISKKKKKKKKKKSRVSWVRDLEPKCLYYFFIFKVYKSRTHELGIVGLSSWVRAYGAFHNPNRLSLNLFRTFQPNLHLWISFFKSEAN